MFYIFSQAVFPKVIGGCLTISPPSSPSIYLSRHPANSAKLIHRNSQINITDFREDILNSDIIKHPHPTASLPSHQYFNTLRNILDKQTPIKRKKEPLHPDKGFINTDIMSVKSLKWKYEPVWEILQSIGVDITILQSLLKNNGNHKALFNTLKESYINPQS